MEHIDDIKSIDDIKIALGNHYQDDLRSFGEIHDLLKKSSQAREAQHSEVMKMLEPLYKQYAFHIEVSEWTKQKLALIGKVLGVLISAGVVWTAVKSYIIMHLPTK